MHDYKGIFSLLEVLGDEQWDLSHLEKENSDHTVDTQKTKYMGTINHCTVIVEFGL